jgi:glycosyltransferase involved in cell wall biosynthesis
LHGVGSYFKYVIPALSDQTIFPVVLRCDDGLRKMLAEEGIYIRCLQHMKGDLRTLLSLAKIIREEKIDLLHVHGYGASACGRILSTWFRIPVIIHQHDSNSLAPWYGWWADYLLRSRTSRLIAVSESVAEFSVRKRSVDKSRITVMRNPIPAPRPIANAHIEEWRAQLGIPRDAKLVGCITRFDPVKGIHYAIRAFADLIQKVPEAYLILFGEGDERERLEHLVKDLELDSKVRLLGFRPDASSYLAALDCFLLPSINEGIPFALLESLAAGTPAVVTDVGGITEVVQNEEAALVVSPRDAKALSMAVNRILTDGELAQRIRENGLELSRRYSVASYASELIDLYERALASSASA